MGSKPISRRATVGIILAVGAGVGLAGDACHVATGTTHYEWDGVPVIWRSAVWFPVLVALGVLLTAWTAELGGTTPVNRRGRMDAITGIALVLALYALTAALRHQPTTVSVTLTAALAVAIWSWWDPSPGALLTAIAFAIAGPLVEIAIVATGASSYGDGADGLGGVAPWLPFLYFGAGAVAARLWAAIERDGAPSG